MPFTSKIVPIIALVLSFAGGCATSTRVQTFADLAVMGGIGPLRILTTDSNVYTITSFTFNDSGITGSGAIERADTLMPFHGTLPYSRIVFIERRSSSFWKGFFMVPVAIGAIAGLAAGLGQPAEFSITRPSGSCPFVYSHDGTDYRLDAEAFGTSLSRALEAETFSLLASLRPVDGILSLRFSNERTETHLLNSVRLYVADLEEAPSASLDIENRLWPLRNPQGPVAARDHSARDILGEILREDGQYWTSDLTHTFAGSGFRDTVDLSFTVPHGVSEGTLVIRGINTDFVTMVYRSAGSILGDGVMQFYHALEHDPLLQQSIRAWLDECSLRIEVDAGDGYRPAGLMPPEANVAPFSRAIRIGGLDRIREPLRVRVSTLAGVWNIDAALMDFSAANPLALIQVPIVDASASNGQPVTGDISASDGRYALLLPPEHVDMTFDASVSERLSRPTYVVAARGFLYEWFPRESDPVLFTPPNGMSAQARIAMLTALIARKEIFLPPLYALWSTENPLTSGRIGSGAPR